MNIAQTKRAIKFALPPNRSVILLGDHGIGKSEVVAQCASELSKELNKPFFFIDWRLAQCELGDINGMMRHHNKGEVTQTVYENGQRKSITNIVKDVTIYDIGEWFPPNPDSYGFLFLDELWRASKDILSAVMEIALDYRYRFRPLPNNCRVIAASNDNLDTYFGNLPDPAIMSRFFKIWLRPIFDEVIKYFEEKEAHPAIIKYLYKNPADLMPGSDDMKKDVEEGKSSTPIPDNSESFLPRPRDWMKISEQLSYMDINNQEPFKDIDYLFYIAKGNIGRDVALNFIEYIRHDFKVYEVKDILNNFKSLSHAFQNMDPIEIDYYNRRISQYISKNIPAAEINNKIISNLELYITTIPKEIATGFWVRLGNDCSEELIQVLVKEKKITDPLLSNMGYKK